MCVTAYPEKNIKGIRLVDVQVEKLEIWDEGIDDSFGIKSSCLCEFNGYRKIHR
jgi:hypothetical protein